MTLLNDIWSSFLQLLLALFQVLTEGWLGEKSDMKPKRQYMRLLLLKEWKTARIGTT